VSSTSDTFPPGILTLRLCLMGTPRVFLQRILQAKPKHVWDIHKTQSLLAPTTCELLPFLHALTGCDTTSKIYGVSKPAALKLLSTNKIFQEVARSFVTSQSRQDVVTHGKKAVMMLLAGDPRQQLDVLRQFTL